MATSGTPTPTHFEPIFFGFLEVWPQELFITMATNFTNSLKVAKIDEKTAISLHSIVVLWIQFFFCQWFGCIRKAQITQHAFRKRILFHIWRKKSFFGIVLVIFFKIAVKSWAVSSKNIDCLGPKYEIIWKKSVSEVQNCAPVEAV